MTNFTVLLCALTFVAGIVATVAELPVTFFYLSLVLGGSFGAAAVGAVAMHIIALGDRRPFLIWRPNTMACEEALRAQHARRHAMRQYGAETLPHRAADTASLAADRAQDACMQAERAGEWRRAAACARAARHARRAAEAVACSS